MAFTPITSRADAQPSDLGTRLMARLFPQNGGLPQAPGAPSSSPQVSPTGLPIAAPPGRMAPSAAPQSASSGVVPAPVAPPSAPMAAAPPAAATAPANPYTDPGAANLYNQLVTQDPWANLPGIFGAAGKGMAKGNWTSEGGKSLADQWQNEAPIDFSGEGQIGRYYDAARSRQEAMDAAMGRSGGGVGAAGQAALFGSEGHDIGDYVRQLIAQRQQEHEAELNQLRQYQQQINLMQLQRQWAKQDSPSFGQEFLGTLGGIAGKAIGAAIHPGTP